VIIVYLLVTGSTPMKAALWGLVVAVLSSFLSSATRMKRGDIISALEQGARNALGVVIACAAAGMIVGTVTLTGLGL